jgi:hypothetical protein
MTSTLGFTRTRPASATTTPKASTPGSSTRAASSPPPAARFPRSRAPDASAQERHDYILACQHADQPPDPSVVAAYVEQVNTVTAEATREL